MEISEERLSSLIILAMIMMSVDSGILLIQIMTYIIQGFSTSHKVHHYILNSSIWYSKREYRWGDEKG